MASRFCLGNRLQTVLPVCPLWMYPQEQKARHSSSSPPGYLVPTLPSSLRKVWGIGYKLQATICPLPVPSEKKKRVLFRGHRTPLEPILYHKDTRWKQEGDKRQETRNKRHEGEGNTCAADWHGREYYSSLLSMCRCWVIGAGRMSLSCHSHAAAGW